MKANSYQFQTRVELRCYNINCIDNDTLVVRMIEYENGNYKCSKCGDNMITKMEHECGGEIKNIL